MSITDLNLAVSRIKEKIPLSEIVGRDVVLKKKGREFVGCCPFHNEKTGSFFVNDDKGTFYCFGCGASGDVFEYLMKRHGLQFTQALEKLADFAGVKLPEKGGFTNRFEIQQKLLAVVVDYFKKCLGKESGIIRYCSSRGFDDTVLAKFAIGYAPPNGAKLFDILKKSGFSVNEILQSGVFLRSDNSIICRFRDRLMFPVFDKSGSPIAFAGRSIREKVMPKYVNSPETDLFQKRKTLYGYNIAVKNVTANQQFIIVEGYADVIMMHKFGFPTTVASMGTALSEWHLSQIWKYSNDPIICLDGDNAGHNAMVKIALFAIKYLQPGKSLRFCSLTEGHDPDSFLRKYGKSKMDHFINNAEYLVDFIWAHFLNELNSIAHKTPENIAKWKRDVLSSVDDIQNQEIRRLYKSELNNRIFASMNSTNDRRVNVKRATVYDFIVDRKEKMLLREAVLLYILTVRPSVIFAVIEELAAIEFSNENFSRLRDRMIENCGLAESTNQDLVEVILEVKNLASKSCDLHMASDEDVLRLWKSVFEFGICKKIQARDLTVAREECSTTFTQSAWERLKALKMDFLDRKGEP